MLQRSTRKVETTLLSYSRQRLPRPARYSTPTKRANAPALDLAHSPPPADFPAYMPPSSSSSSSKDASTSSFGVRGMDSMKSFLRRDNELTILSTPLPEGTSSNGSAIPDSDVFHDTHTQDKVAVIDACMHAQADVPRAKAIFDKLRDDRPTDPQLGVGLYNKMIHGYVKMAEKEQANRVYWVDEAWSLYSFMQENPQVVKPTAGIYSVMLQAWMKFNPDAETPAQGIEMQDPATLLRAMYDSNPDYNLEDVITSTYTENSIAADMIKLLSKTALEMNLTNALETIQKLQQLGSSHGMVDESMMGVPEVNPVQKLKSAPRDSEGNLLDPNAVPEYETPFNLDVLRKHLANISFARQVLPGDREARQRLLEESVLTVAKDRMEHEQALLARLELGPSGLQTAGLQTWMWNWHQGLMEKLKEDIPKLLKSEKLLPARSAAGQRERIGDFLAVMKPERLSLIVIMELIRLHGTGGIIDGMKTARALLTVGKTVENEFKSVVAKKSKIDLPTPRPHAANSTEGWFSKSGIASGHQRRQSYARFQSDHEDWVGEWSQGVRVKIGSFLVDALMNVATVDDTRTNRLTGEQETIKAPAFFHAYEYQKGHKLGVLKLHERITERLSKDPLDGTLHPRHLPMLVQPKPWIAYDKGGYLVNDATVMRFKESTEQLAYLARADRLGHCELVFSGLDVLGSTPWNVNRDVFNVVLETWNSGQRIGKMPPAEYDQPEPEKLPETDTDPHARNVYQQRLKAYQQLKAANHSDRCSVNYKIEIARAFLGDTFYFPHNLDFRGRAYPIPPHLNHIGDDLSRGLLLFADKKPLGERGLRWLKIHLSNLFGYDKASFDERVHFVHEHLEDIYDSAENPLTGRKWWQKADDPWQCLATCFELRNALESGNPLAFESRLPLHQDGTCNGLQHYAALGGDAQGAKQVNLAVTDRPSDVYTFVADMVEAEILRDLAKPNPPPQAAMLTGRVSRKVVKQTVMTTVYGVTYIGAREQIDKQLKNRGEIPEEETWGAASYLAKKVLACIGDLFKGAKGIQTYLNLVARVISKSIPPERLKETTKKLNNGVRSISSAQLAKEQMTSVIWTTPLGLPIVQPYRKTRRRQVMTKMQSVFISDPNMPSSVNSTKQASAFPPNFIHSLDATHMMLTALECRSQNLTFASVHDSYWTHASTIDDMNAIIRDTFIALHSSNVLERLDKEIRERYKGYKIAAATVSTGKINEVVGAYNAGVRAGRKPAADVADLVTVAADDMPSIEEGAIEVAVTTPVKDVVEGERLVAKAAAQQGMSAEELKAEAQVDVHETEDTAEEVGGKTAKGEVEVRTRFHDLALYLPELPNKGDFDVKTIQNSLYFFS